MRFVVFPLLSLLALGLPVACSSSDSTPPAATPGTVDPGTPEEEVDNGTDSGTPAPPPGETSFVTTTTETMQHEGASRKYILSVPRDYDANRAYPVYFWLHGNPGSAEAAASFRLDRVTKNEAIIVYPGGLGVDWDHGASVADNPDVTFLVALVDVLAGKLSIDRRRILLSGWSGGGFMSSAVACRYAGTFRAIGIHAGGAPYDPNGGPNPTCPGASIATLVTHGDPDPAVPFSSGEYAAQFWAQKNGCGDATSPTTPAPCMTYDGCPATKPVEACFIKGLGHPLWDQAIAVEWAWFKALP